MRRRRRTLGEVVIPWMWGDAGHPLPPGYTVNYGNLWQLYTLARAAGDQLEADRIATEINRITALAPFGDGCGVPLTDLVPTGAGFVYCGQELADIQEADRVYRYILAGNTIACSSVTPAVRRYVPVDVLLRGLIYLDPAAAVACVTGTPITQPPAGGGGGDGTFPTDPKDPKPGTQPPGSGGGGGGGGGVIDLPPKDPKPSPVTPVLAGLSLNAWGAILGGVVLLLVLSRD